MTEKELLQEIQKSADSVEIPDSITPEEIIGKLHITEKKRNKKHGFPAYSIQRTVSAATVLLLCGILSAVAWNIRPAAPSTADFPVPENDTSIPAETENISLTVQTPKQDAGSLYTVAKDYDQIYELLKSSQKQKETYYDTGTEDSAPMEESALLRAFTESKKESFTFGYSATNLQTLGVDESDCVKTDGRYIYTVTGSKILITDTKDGHLTLAGSITPSLESSDSILEFYVDDGKLMLFIQHYDTSMEYSYSNSAEEDDVTYAEDSAAGFLPLAEADSAKKYSTNTKASTLLSTYDISDPGNPVLEGTVTQDGTYRTSRKIGDIVYLFTNQELFASTLSQTPKEGFIPCINGETIPCDSIYLPDNGSSGLILSSVNINEPDKIVDKLMIIHNFVNIYVGNDSIYLYETVYDNNNNKENILTEIAGFSMRDGILNAISAASVKGEILDTFAINESEQCLRILTTSSDETGNASNNLYLLDQDMKLTGSLTDIAKGEQIYAARYFHDIAYFITYRNTDPLFAADISDPFAPRLLGELEITGFSEYLHLWENDKLLGIGYETDPDSGEIKGLKLVMFDISDPTDLKVLDTITLKDFVYSPALYDYKCVLADSSANLIGFAGEYQEESGDYTSDYLLYSWENNHFIQKLSTPLSNQILFDYLRGIYIDENFYIADFNQIISFDRKNNYKKIEELILK